MSVCVGGWVRVCVCEGLLERDLQFLYIINVTDVCVCVRVCTHARIVCVYVCT